MAHSRPPKGRLNKVKKERRSQLNYKIQAPTATQLINEATAFVHTGDPEAALPLALRALALSQAKSNLRLAGISNFKSIPAAPARESLPALKLLAEINLELGEAVAARDYFRQAVDIDPEGEIVEDEGGGVEKFLWLAQLCEEGGEVSVRWFERGAAVLRRDIAMAEKEGGDQDVLEEKRKKLAGVLCGIIEVYMTDLSFDPNAEAQCTSLIASALALAPSSPTPHQTQASILISQSDIPAAQAALRTSLSLWQHLPASHPDVLDFPSRISLSRLLLEVGMEDEALEVLSGVVEGDESSVEGWYLGGWGLWLLAERAEGGRQAVEGESASADIETAAEDEVRIVSKNESDKKGPDSFTQDQKDRITHLRDSRTWLNTCLSLAAQLDYEDDRLRDHAQELVQEIERLLLEQGVPLEEDEGDEEEDEWEGVDSSSSSSSSSSSEEDDRKASVIEKKEDEEEDEGTPIRGGGRKERGDTEQINTVDAIMSGT